MCTSHTDAEEEGDDGPGGDHVERIRYDGPVKNSIHDMIQTLSIKLDSAARYGLYTEDARADGYEDCAELFTRLREHELQAIDDLKECLLDHIDDM